VSSYDSYYDVILHSFLSLPRNLQHPCLLAVVCWIAFCIALSLGRSQECHLFLVQQARQAGASGWTGNSCCAATWLLLLVSVECVVDGKTTEEVILVFT